MTATFNPQAAAEVGLDTPIPEAVRSVAEKTVAQTREVYDRSKDALDASILTFERSFDSAGQGAATFNRKIIDIAQRNLNSGFDLAKSLAGAKNLSEMVECRRPIGRSCWGRSRPKPEKFVRSRPSWRPPRASRSRSR